MDGGTAAPARLRALPVLAAVIFLVLHVFAYPATRFSNDSYRYAREAYEFLGDPPGRAQQKALAAYCADTARLVHRNRLLDQTKFRAPGREAEYRRSCAAKYRDGLAPSGPEYDRIFRTRPAYPLMAAPLVALLGAKAGLTAVALAFTAAAGFLVYLLLRALRAPPPAAVLGQVLYYVTPLALWGGRPLSEGPVVALMTALLLASVWLLQNRLTRGALLLTGALALGFAVKYSSFLIVAPFLAAAAYAALLFVRRTRHRGTWVLAGLSTAGTLAAAVVSRVLRLPGMTDSLQDVFTLHWTRPEVADPWRSLVRLDANYWWQWLQKEALAPLLLTLLACGTWGLWKRSVPVALCVLATGLTGFATMAAHPLAVEQDRLYVQVWLIPVIGLPLALEQLWRRAAPAPAAPGDAGTAGEPAGPTRCVR
ncbi:hypothetical protein JK359_34970 [Streptomyces actinomycinicus]|uniref:Uncharacterized protein n=1 Tax=Streptomyces actinomycinicus TaxID=1695166 RepID=A0A937EQ92_9ACTN|nr:hypothetical protein [Streptomyces actinomycinicus]MBL1087111.1 hypothetical protein [Streptomyces actinomycinicus]